MDIARLKGFRVTKCHEQSRLSQKGQQRRPQPLSNGRKDVLGGGRTTAKILKVIPCLPFYFFLNPHQQHMDRALLNKTELYVHGGCKNKTKMLAPCITLMHFEEEEQKNTRYKNSVRPNMCVCVPDCPSCTAFFWTHKRWEKSAEEYDMPPIAHCRVASLPVIVLFVGVPTRYPCPFR